MSHTATATLSHVHDAMRAQSLRCMYVSQKLTHTHVVYVVHERSSCAPCWQRTPIFAVAQLSVMFAGENISSARQRSVMGLKPGAIEAAAAIGAPPLSADQRLALATARLPRKYSLLDPRGEVRLNRVALSSFTGDQGVVNQAKCGCCWVCAQAQVLVMRSLIAAAKSVGAEKAEATIFGEDSRAMRSMLRSGEQMAISIRALASLLTGDMVICDGGFGIEFFYAAMHCGVPVNNMLRAPRHFRPERTACAWNDPGGRRCNCAPPYANGGDCKTISETPCDSEEFGLLLGAAPGPEWPTSDNERLFSRRCLVTGVYGRPLPADVESTNAVKQELMENGPMVLMIYMIMTQGDQVVSTTIPTAAQGGGGCLYQGNCPPYPHLKCVYGGHAVTLIGWDDDKLIENYSTGMRSRGAWIVRNSWGKGYFCKPQSPSVTVSTTFYVQYGCPNVSLAYPEVTYCPSAAAQSQPSQGQMQLARDSARAAHNRSVTVARAAMQQMQQGAAPARQIPAHQYSTQATESAHGDGSNQAYMSCGAGTPAHHHAARQMMQHAVPAAGFFCARPQDVPAGGCRVTCTTTSPVHPAGGFFCQSRQAVPAAGFCNPAPRLARMLAPCTDPPRRRACSGSVSGTSDMMNDESTNNSIIIIDTPADENEDALIHA